MLQTLKRFTQKITAGAVASAFLHAIILALLVFGLPQLRMESEEPAAIQVQLVIPQEDVQQEEHENAEPAPEPTSDTAETTPANQPDVQPLRPLRPVFQFGKEDAGPGESEDGDALSGSKMAEALPSQKPLQEPAAPEQTVDTPEAPPIEPTAAPETVDEPQRPTETTETARSLHNNDSPVATTAMGDLPRGVRAGELCATELRRQLHGSLPVYRPNLLPTYRLDEGTVLEVRKGAFRSNAGWFDLKFSCEIDEAATRIVSFEFEVGSPIPSADWAVRGLPAS